MASPERSDYWISKKQGEGFGAGDIAPDGGKVER